MAITLRGESAELVGLSSDNKPNDVAVNTIFHELDTDDYYYFTGDSWEKVGGAE